MTLKKKLVISHNKHRLRSAQSVSLRKKVGKTQSIQGPFQTFRLNFKIGKCMKNRLQSQKSSETNLYRSAIGIEFYKTLQVIW